MKYLKNLILSLKEIFVVITVMYIIIISSILIFGFNRAIILGSIMVLIFQTIYLIFKKRTINFKFNNTFYFPYILLGISVAIIYNMVIFKLGIKFEVTEGMPIILNIVYSGIAAPIFEEILFRYSLINKLEKFNSKKMVIILSGVIFAMFHSNIITAIYAIIIGTLNAYLYMKERNILVPIMVHMSGNIIVNLLFDYNIWIFILGIILLLISTLIIKKNSNHYYKEPILRLLK